MERVIAGIRMSFGEKNLIPFPEFMRIHQLSPFYMELTDAKKLVYLKELKQAYRDLQKIAKNGAASSLSESSGG